MPAQSPTLSPTLSAITAGLRGSSSGIPASILPTRSAPTSAAFVKMPPPRRAKTEISEPPKARPTRSSIAELGELSSQPREDPVVAGDAEQAEPDDEQAGDRAGAEGDVERRLQAAARGLGDADVRAHRDVHADEPGRGGERGADQEADRGPPTELVVEAEQRGTARSRPSRSSCTACAGTPRRPPAPRARSPASARCPAGCRSSHTSSPMPAGDGDSAHTSANSTGCSLKKPTYQHPLPSACHKDSAEWPRRGEVLYHKPVGAR